MQKKLSICCFVIVEACLCGSKVSYFFSWLYNLALLNV